MSTETSFIADVDPNQPPPPDVLPDYSRFVTEDDAPLDNFFSEKQQRLLVEPVYSAGLRTVLGRPILAAANVGLFYIESQPAVVPDVLLSLDVQLPEDLWPRENRSYYIWRLGKPPDVAVEIVSNSVGGEASRKPTLYARLGVSYYVVFDPMENLHQGVLRVYELRGRTYVELEQPWLPDVGLGVTLWQGQYEEHSAVWVRWCDSEGGVIPTGAELLVQEHQRAEQERQRAEQERQRAEQEHQRAEQEYQRAERLAARLRELGIDPEATDG